VVIAKSPEYVTISVLERVTINPERLIVTFLQFYLKLNNLLVR